MLNKHAHIIASLYRDKVLLSYIICRFGICIMGWLKMDILLPSGEFNKENCEPPY
jgi:hypothetical protein